MGNQNSGLSKDEVTTLEEKTHFTKDEIKSMHKAFKEQDTDGDLQLDSTEFASFMKKQLGEDTSDETLGLMFRSFDHDESGGISFNELLLALSMLSVMPAEDKLEYLFEIYDADSSGHLSDSELRAVIEQMLLVAQTLGRETEAAASFVDGIVAKLDHDQDGSITKEEWVSKGLSTPSLLVLLNAGAY
ncbi:calcium-binding protein NCS-1 [Thecamonas trahens ATCC 50062]|uniref:Calcium-binding protein NCS-1 n=1 Tax=Thecamonas trahens ATCC 50062 TaxID=461836 RepID=A0A0L0DK49_THETB|nr:calcium-binding protein NCS-1 [Thecamonas trahens ATCC 50062]KNC51738.1 calcium-binding protein NCS-1 [Thecamonas trahens ATCC 50062]|eukprot:XP_013755866.1 calcium-binding protein NCS-1 [Thecamonas trahens ATCC 50062]